MEGCAGLSLEDEGCAGLGLEDEARKGALQGGMTCLRKKNGRVGEYL